MSDAPLIELSDVSVSHQLSAESLAFSAEIALLADGGTIRIHVSNTGQGGCNEYEPPLHREYCTPFKEAAKAWAEANGETFEVEDAFVRHYLVEWQNSQRSGPVGRDTWVLVYDEDGGEDAVLTAHGPFTQAEADAFWAGVEFVNDGAVETVTCVTGDRIPAGYVKRIHDPSREAARRQTR